MCFVSVLRCCSPAVLSFTEFVLICFAESTRCAADFSPGPVFPGFCSKLSCVVV